MSLTSDFHFRNIKYFKQSSLENKMFFPTISKFQFVLINNTYISRDRINACSCMNVATSNFRRKCLCCRRFVIVMCVVFVPCKCCMLSNGTHERRSRSPRRPVFDASTRVSYGTSLVNMRRHRVSVAGMAYS